MSNFYCVFYCSEQVLLGGKHVQPIIKKARIWSETVNALKPKLNLHATLKTLKSKAFDLNEK